VKREGKVLHDVDFLLSLVERIQRENEEKTHTAVGGDEKAKRRPRPAPPWAQKERGGVRGTVSLMGAR